MAILKNEIGNKQSLQSEGYLIDNITLSLSNLYIIKYSDCVVFSVCHIQTKDILAYAIYTKVNYLNDCGWLNLEFNKVINISLDSEYNVIPFDFKDKNKPSHLIKNAVCDIEYVKKDFDAHILDGIFQFHITQNAENALYIYQFNNRFSITLFKGNKLAISNIFSCSDENEVLYFITNILLVNGIEKDNIVLYYDYSLVEKYNIIDFLKPFFNHIYALSHPTISDEAIPHLAEKLFCSYAVSLCE